MNILYLGRDTLACQAVICMLNNQLRDHSITFISVDDAVFTSSDKKYDVVILDDENVDAHLDMTLEKLNHANAPLILLTSRYREITSLHDVLPHLHGIIDRNGNTDFFIESIFAVAAGGYCYSWDVLNKAAEEGEPLDEVICKKTNLTAREKEILRLCLAGETNKSISRRLCRSEKTISAHKSNMLKKLGIKSWQLHDKAFLSSL